MCSKLELRATYTPLYIFFFSILRHEKGDKGFNSQLKIRLKQSTGEVSKGVFKSRRGIFELIDYKQFTSS